MKRLIASLLLLVIAIQICTSEGYKPLTREQAENWWNSPSLTKEEKIDFIIKYDFVEHIRNPLFELPKYVAIVIGDDVVCTPIPQETSLQIGYLNYTIPFPKMEFKNIIPEEKGGSFAPYAITSVISFLIGSVLGLTVGFLSARI